MTPLEAIAWGRAEVVSRLDCWERGPRQERPPEHIVAQERERLVAFDEAARVLNVLVEVKIALRTKADVSRRLADGGAGDAAFRRGAAAGYEDSLLLLRVCVE